MSMAKDAINKKNHSHTSKINRDTEFALALKALETDLLKAVAKKDKVAEARAHYGLGILFSRKDVIRYCETAFEHFTKAINLASNLEIKAYALRERTLLFGVFEKVKGNKLKDLNEAYNIIKELKDFKEPQNIVERARILLGYAEELMALEKIEEAIPILINARTLRPTHEGTVAALMQANTLLQKKTERTQKSDSISETAAFPQLLKERIKQAADKVWQSEVTQSKDVLKDGYILIPAGTKDIQKVIEAYNHGPVPGYEIGKVQVIHNPELNDAFAVRLKLLQNRQGNPSFKSKWAEENETAWREAIYNLFEKISASYQDKDTPNVKLLPVWHGTKPEILASIFKTGFATLSSEDSTDEGYFGRGIYSAFEAEYSHRIYSKGALLLNWYACFSVYPVIEGDLTKLIGKGNYGNYDAHVAPVVPEFPGEPESDSYIPCKPGQIPQYTEIVVFETSQCLPRYLVELQKSLLKEPSVSSDTGARGELITTGNSAVLYALLKKFEADKSIPAAADKKGEKEYLRKKFE